MPQITLERFESTAPEPDVEPTIEERKAKLYWTPDNPDRGNVKRPQMMKMVIERYYKRPDELPYENPFTTGSEGAARARHRTYYWLTHPFGDFVCPDCDRPLEMVSGVDVHHKDENPRNGDPDNLQALCRRCHGVRHGGTFNVSALTVEEWGEALLNPESYALEL